MNRITIIGVGQLGSRYLQGILASNTEREIYLVEPSDLARETAISRIEGIQTKNQVTFLRKISELPDQIDLAIIATNANVRAAVVDELLQVTHLRFMVLEKVLFQKIEDYDYINYLLGRQEVTCWVNHPKRTFESYRELKKLLDKQEVPIKLSASGSNWGLACNGLHVIDTWCYLFDDRLGSLELPEIVSWKPSVRDGFMEFTGSVSGTLKKGTTFTMLSSEEERSPITWEAEFNSLRILVEEGGPNPNISLFYPSSEEPYKILPFEMAFQSTLSGPLVESIFSTGTCDLPKFEESILDHLVFIESLLKAYNSSMGLKENTILPIT